MKAIILAAGASTRTAPLTLTRPKPLLPFLGRTILHYTLDLLRDMNIIDEVILVVNYKKQMIIDMFGDDYRGMLLTYVDQKEAKGTGHAALSAEVHIHPQQDKSVLILNGDDLFARDDIATVLKNYPAIAVKEVEHPENYGIFEAKRRDHINLYAESLEEKPKQPRSNLANVGIYHVGIDFFKYLHSIKPSKRGELEITDAIKTYMDWHDIKLIPLKNYWIPIQYPWDLLTATEFMMNLAQEPKPIIDSSVEIKKNVTITGTSVIDKNVKIGSDCHIENSLIFEGAKIGSRCIIKNSIIGEFVKIENDFSTIDELDILEEPLAEMTSVVKGKKVQVDRDKLGVIIGDKTKISKQIETEPGVKIWPNIRVYNTKHISEDITE